MKITQEDLEFLKKETEGKTDNEKLKYVFDWFVENWSYDGYDKFDFAATGVGQELCQLTSLDPYDDKYRMTDEERKQTNLDNDCSNIKKWFIKLSDEQFETLMNNNPNRAKMKEILKQKRALKPVYEKSKQETVIRKIYLSHHKRKYSGVCHNFASDFADVCKQLNLNKVVLNVGGSIDNGVSSVGHDFNAVVDLNDESVRYIDISFAIHAREQVEGFHSPFGDFNSENPDDFFLKTQDEIEKAEGRPRKYNDTKEKLLNKAKQSTQGPLSL